MVRLCLIGDVPPQSTEVAKELVGHGMLLHITDKVAFDLIAPFAPDLIVVAGWRRLVPPDILAVPRCGTVGFHSARLPEYPGRAPVPWTLVRGDEFAYNTLLYLDEGVDSGDIIDERRIRVYPGDTPDTLYYHMARTAAEMLRQHLPALLEGTAPRTPQDPTRRGRLTTVDGWAQWHELQRLGAGHA